MGNNSVQPYADLCHTHFKEPRTVGGRLCRSTTKGETIPGGVARHCYLATYKNKEKGAVDLRDRPLILTNFMTGIIALLHLLCILDEIQNGRNCNWGSLRGGHGAVLADDIEPSNSPPDAPHHRQIKLNCELHG